MVVKSTQSDPGRSTASAPAVRITASTWSGRGSDVSNDVAGSGAGVCGLGGGRARLDRLRHTAGIEVEGGHVVAGLDEPNAHG